MTNISRPRRSFPALLATFRRWRDVTVYALVAATITSLVVPTFRNRIPFEFSALNSMTADVLVLGLACALIVVLHKLIGIRLSHVRHFLRYPPLPISVVLGLAASGAIQAVVSLSPSLQTSLVPLLAIGAIYTSLWVGQAFVVYLGQLVSDRLHTDNIWDQTTDLGEFEQSDEALRNWLERESPIEDAGADIFRHSLIAERLLTKLAKGDTTIALQGAFGSGKTSIGRIAQAFAKERNLSLIFADVSCWGFTQSLDAQEELLSQVIRSVGEHVEIFSLRSLPTEYANAIEGHGSWYNIIVRLVSGKRSPQGVLLRLSPILAAIRRNVVLFIEDADRNFPTFDMSQLEALLVRLREISGLSFLLCISPAQKMDLTKLCDRTEIIPPLDERATIRLIDQTRQLVLNRHPVGIMLDGLEDLAVSDRNDKTIDHYLGFYWPRQIILPMLARTPRILKRALRRVVDAWPDLCGEVNIGDLIGISILREGAPEAFSFFQRNQRFFRPSTKEEKDIMESAKTKLKESLAEEWQEITASKSFDARSAAWLMKQIDPFSAGVTGLMIGSHMIRRQSIQSERRGHIYARRLFTETTQGDEISDQRLFGLLKDAQTGDKTLAELAEVITDSQFASDAFEEFTGALQFDRFLPLLSQVYRVIRTRRGERLSRDDHPGFFAPWRMVAENRPSDFGAWLQKEVVACIPTSLRLLTDIYYFWLGADRHTFNERELSRHAIRDALRASWTTISPSQIASGFDSSFPYTLFHLFFTSDYQKPETVPLSKIEDWTWSAEPLLAAAQVAPSKMLPQVLWVLNSATNRGREVPQFTLDEALLEKWFGRRANEVLALIAKGFELDAELGAQERYVITKAIEQFENGVEFLGK